MPRLASNIRCSTRRVALPWVRAMACRSGFSRLFGHQTLNRRRMSDKTATV
ncbi:MAG TPA: hypothetical protein VG034_10160 [Acidimicrobiia bacterium]|jgi:hypothetical protein|nr:hypothetical protein [Acidimicrobiia bacterium]